MLISIDWIKDFVELPDEDPKKVGEKFTLGSAEVEDVVLSGDHLPKVKVAEIISFERHPEADKLNLVTFNFGDKEPKRVVCGAANVRVGLKTFFAPNGTTLPIGFTLEPKKIRGVMSDGMLCSEEELGLAESSEGIIELPTDTKVGMTLGEYYNQKQDILLDVDNKSLTHRPDMWGHYGIAREFAAIFEKPLKRSFDKTWEDGLKGRFNSEKSPIAPKVEKDSSCLAYYGLSVDNVTVGESPEWMKRRLRAVGLRPINNIVDISNYVMLELGIPLHIFDRDTIKDNTIHIKRVGKEDTFVTLDEQERKLIESDTVICDNEKPLVLAGIMGGLNSGVTEKTTKVFIEVANWKAAEVRRTSTRLGLRTDSSQRYEKTLDSKLCERTLLRTLELLLDFCPEAKVIGKAEYDGENLSAIKELCIHTSAARITKVLGIEVPEEKVKKILESLDFKVEGNGDLKVTVPSFRATKDVEYEADIIEEIGRIIGYDNITPVSPKLDISPVRLSNVQVLHRQIKNYMTFQGKAFEVMTYPMIGEKHLKRASWKDDQPLKILNSLSKDAEIMRNSLMPSLLEAAALNTKNFSEFRFFELGRSYHSDSKQFSKDSSQLGIVFYDKEKNPFMDLVNTVDGLLNATNVPADLVEKHPKFKNNLVSEEWKGTHPFEFLNIRIMGRMNGVVLSIHPLLLRDYKIKGHLAVCLIDLSSFEEQRMKDQIKYKPLPKFPGSSFDWTVVADNDAPVGTVLDSLKKVKIKELQSTKVVDIFNMEGNKKAVTLRAHFLDPEKTLSTEFLTSAREQLMATLDKAGFPLKG